MPVENYKSGQLSGDTWVRVKGIYIVNELNEIPCATFNEEKVVVAGEELIKFNFGDLSVRMKDPLYEFPMRNPETSEIIENVTAKYQDIYTLLYSAYYDAALKRDDGIFIGYDEPENIEEQVQRQSHRVV